ncbi:hypothetical protein HN51_030855 [Arachis hypogaea]
MCTASSSTSQKTLQKNCFILQPDCFFYPSTISLLLLLYPSCQSSSGTDFSEPRGRPCLLRLRPGGYAGVIFCDLPSKNVSHPLASKVPVTHVQNALGKPLSMASDAYSSNTRRGIGGAGGQRELRSGNATSSWLQPQDVTEAHCKFFLWVDDHIVRVRAGEATRGSGDGKQSDVGKHLGMDNLIDHVEERIAKLEKLLNKKSREAELRKKAREAAARDMEASSTTDVAVEVERKLEFVHGVLMAYCRSYQVLSCTGLGSVIVQQSSGVYKCSLKTQGHHVELSRFTIIPDQFWLGIKV